MNYIVEQVFAKHLFRKTPEPYLESSQRSKMELFKLYENRFAGNYFCKNFNLDVYLGSEHASEHVTARCFLLNSINA